MEEVWSAEESAGDGTAAPHTTPYTTPHTTPAEPQTAKVESKVKSKVESTPHTTPHITLHTTPADPQTAGVESRVKSTVESKSSAASLQGATARPRDLAAARNATSGNAKCHSSVPVPSERDPCLPRRPSRFSTSTYSWTIFWALAKAEQAGGGRDGCYCTPSTAYSAR